MKQQTLKKYGLECDGEKQKQKTAAAVMQDILSSLPVKAFCRFKCVSEKWSSLISDPCFQYLRGTKSKQNCLFLTIDPEENSDSEDDVNDDDIGHYFYRFTGMDNEGRVLIEFTPKFKFASYLVILQTHLDVICLYDYQDVYLCNPSARQLLNLPKSSHSSPHDSIGFGYLSSTKEYKVVRLFSRGGLASGHKEMGCEVFSFTNPKSSDNISNMTTCGGTSSECKSDEHDWRLIEESCQCEVESRPTLGDETLYWKNVGEGGFAPKDKLIVSFDLRTEKFKTIATPSGLCMDLYSWDLKELGGKLCLVENFEKGTDELIIKIWMLGGYDKHVWKLKYAINYAAIAADFGGLEDVEPVRLIDREILFIDQKERLVYYHVDTKRSRRLKLDQPEFLEIGFYRESLVSLGSK